MPTALDTLCYLPRPVHIENTGGVFILPLQPVIQLATDPAASWPIARFLADDLALHSKRNAEISAAQHRHPAIALYAHEQYALPADGYVIQIDPDGLRIEAATPQGLFYARTTLRQILMQTSHHLPCGRIEDQPDFPQRGYMLDISRDKVPTMDTLFDLIDLLSQFKINELQLYTEHTFAYPEHPAVWAEASPITPGEMLELDAYCRNRYIELVPNQNCLGHMERWLQHERYRPLAECPDGFKNPWGDNWRSASTLNPEAPGSERLIRGLLDNLLPHFSSGQINVGCDEPWELGQGATAASHEKLGPGRVYLNWLLKLHAMCRERGVTMQFWADIINQHKELISELPEDIIPLEWGYDAGHPWEERCQAFAQLDLPYYVCPGTSSWNSLGGRTRNALTNIREAATFGNTHGATGLLNTDWGDCGHIQFLPISYLPIVAGAALSWNGSACEEDELIKGLDLFVFQDSAEIMGKWVYDLGTVFDHDPEPAGNGTRLAHGLIYETISAHSLNGLTHEHFDQVIESLRLLRERLHHARMSCAQAALITKELETATLMMAHAAQRGQAILGDQLNDSTTCRQLASELLPILGTYRELWLARNRVGGLRESVGRLEFHMKHYLKNGACEP